MSLGSKWAALFSGQLRNSANSTFEQDPRFYDEKHYWVLL